MDQERAVFADAWFSWGNFAEGWLWIAIGFALFRLFDVLKPWPIRWFDRRVHGGFGIMLDDVLAGLAAGESRVVTITAAAGVAPSGSTTCPSSTSGARIAPNAVRSLLR